VRVVLALAVTAILGACRGDAVKCEKACRNYGTLVYHKNAEDKVAAEPAATRDALRKRLADKFESDLANGIAQCTSQCQSANNTDDVDCMIAAKTGDQALACLK
jgi:hypothetical protein